MADLFEHYKNDPAAADRRYKGKVFQIQGPVERFAPTLFVRKYAVVLETPGADATRLARSDWETPPDSVTFSNRSACGVFSRPNLGLPNSHSL